MKVVNKATDPKTKQQLNLMTPFYWSGGKK